VYKKQGCTNIIVSNYNGKSGLLLYC